MSALRRNDVNSVSLPVSGVPLPRSSERVSPPTLTETDSLGENARRPPTLVCSENASTSIGPRWSSRTTG